MPQKRNNKKIVFFRGSVVIFALVLMFILAVTTIGIITTAAISRKASISTGNATGAFQVAESGMETTLQYFIDNFDKKLSDIPSLPPCDANGIVTYNSSNKIRFRSSPSTYITDCDTLISQVKIIKSIGITKRETQAMEEDVFLGATKLLIHFDGVSETQNDHLVDSSYYYNNNQEIILEGDAQLDSNIKKFGQKSVYFDGNDYISMPDSDYWDFGSGDFTIDFWVRFETPPLPGSAAGIFSQNHNSNHLIVTSLLNDGGTYKWSFNVEDGVDSTSILIAADTINPNEWYHVAYVRKENELKIFQDGSLLATEPFSRNMPNINNEDVVIGWSGDGNNYLKGHLDELRISKGVARWWEEDDDEFDVPTSEYWPD